MGPIFDGLLQIPNGLVLHTTEVEISEHFTGVLAWCNKPACLFRNLVDPFTPSTFGEFDQIPTEVNKITGCCPQLGVRLLNCLLK